MRLEVFKFGGTSVGSAERMRAVAQIVKEALTRTHVVVVTSAMTGVTNQLVAGAAAAARGDRKNALELAESLRERHLEALEALSSGPPPIEIARSIGALVEDLAEVLRAVTLIGELTPRTRDRILPTGEKLAVLLLTVALREAGVNAEAVDADTFIETDASFGEANPLTGLADRTIISALRPRLDRDITPIVTGYCGRAPDGATTTLGRGGSDFSATIIAGALSADEVTIWTDVSGVYSTDPRVVPEARILRQLNYREAAEMSYYGAKVLHQRTMIPVATLEIPVRIRNSMAPTDEGTVVNGRFTPGSHPVKAISAVRDQALVSVEGKGMAGVPGVAARLFQALAEHNISVTMISQSSSESSICLAIPGDSAMKAESAIKRMFREELSRGIIEEVIVRRRVGIVAAVGLGMAHTPGVAGRALTALGLRRVNVLAIAQGSSELNLSIAVTDDTVTEALRGLHLEFGLHRLDTGAHTPRGFDLMLLGCGQIGRALISLLLDRRAHVFERFDLQARVVAIADRGGYLFDPQGLSRPQIERALSAKAEGSPISALDGAITASHSREMVEAALRFRLARPVLVDVSDSEASFETFLSALERESDVVTANKKPLAVSLDRFEALMASASANGRLLKVETTVGAGLPVVDTLEMLLATGDRLHRARGCLSGTLGYVMSRLEAGALLSEAVEEAAKLGYTEPDPVADLSGADVARKALILGRLSELAPSEQQMHSEGLVSPDLAGLDRETLLTRLREEYDAPLTERIAAAKARGEVLRYVASVKRGEIKVGVEAVPADSPLGMLKGTDNMIVFESERYSDRPLVITGPGAGIDVTAMGVLGDILRIAAERS